MRRKEAIEKLALKKLSELSKVERAEQLESMMYYEDWTDCKEWLDLSKEIKEEFEKEEEIENSYSEKYNEVLMIWLRNGLQSVTNEFLRTQLNVELIEGNPIKLFACPCCGRRTIGERGDYEICGVCWWEDDGYDNESIFEHSGPNHMSLMVGRYNFLKYGISSPDRTDLIAIQEPVYKYELGRVFEIVNDYMIEKKSEWKSKIITNT